MHVKVDIDEKYSDTEIIIQTSKWSEEIQSLVDFIHQETPRRLFGIDGDQTVLLNPNQIDYFYTEQRKTYAKVDKQSLEIKMKLFEIEETFKSTGFMRFSKSVIGNLQHINRFELSFNGNLCVYFHSGNKEYISRKYVATVKKGLETGGHNHDI